MALAEERTSKATTPRTDFDLFQTNKYSLKLLSALKLKGVFGIAV